MISAVSIARAAFTVNRSGSPGPAPARITVRGGQSCGFAEACLTEQSFQFGEAGAAACAGPGCAADGGRVGEAVARDGVQDRTFAHLMTDTENSLAVLRTFPAGEERGRIVPVPGACEEGFERFGCWQSLARR